MGKSKGVVAIMNYGEVIIAKIKTCCSNFRRAVLILGEAAISILVEVVASIEVAVVSSFRAGAKDRSDNSPRRVVG